MSASEFKMCTFSYSHLQPSIFGSGGHISTAYITSLCLQDFPGPVQADGRVLRHSEGLCGVRILPGQGHQPTGAGQHLL